MHSGIARIADDSSGQDFDLIVKAGLMESSVLSVLCTDDGYHLYGVEIHRADDAADRIASSDNQSQHNNITWLNRYKCVPCLR